MRVNHPTREKVCASFAPFLINTYINTHQQKPQKKAERAIEKQRSSLDGGTRAINKYSFIDIIGFLYIIDIKRHGVLLFSFNCTEPS